MPLRKGLDHTLKAVRNWLFFISGPWQWLIFFVLLSSELARRWREALERLKLPIYVRFPVYRESARCRT